MKAEQARRMTLEACTNLDLAFEKEFDCAGRECRKTSCVVRDALSRVASAALYGETNVEFELYDYRSKLALMCPVDHVDMFRKAMERLGYGIAPGNCWKCGKANCSSHPGCSLNSHFFNITWHPGTDSE
jgi:hypothetical protein